MTAPAAVVTVQVGAAFRHGCQVRCCQPGRRLAVQAAGSKVHRGLPGDNVLAAAHPINGAGVVIGNVDRPVRSLGHVHGAPGNITFAVEAAEKIPLLDAVLAPVQGDHLVAVRRAAVPGAVQGDQGAAPVVFRPARTVYKADPQGCVVGAKAVGRGGGLALRRQRVGAHVGIRYIGAVVIGPAVKITLGDPVELAGRKIVPQQVAAIVGGVQVATPGRPVEAHAVAQAGGDDLAAAAIRCKTHHGGAPLVRLLADIAG